jgi:glycosyltransferase involved in cell wall biosynthesis
VNSEFWVISNEAPNFKKIHPERLRFIKWSPLIETTLLPQLDVGLMPLLFDEWSRGKCSFKMLQYMAAEVPVLVTPVGMNVEILSLGKVGIAAKKLRDWRDALFFLYHHREIGMQYGQTGRQIVEQYFSRQLISECLADIFKKLI